jgi:hypothetical protein
MGFGDGGGVLSHGGVEGGEGGQFNEEEEGCRVGLPEEGGTTGVAALWPNSSERRGVPIVEHPLDGVVVLRGWGGCAQAARVGSGKERGSDGCAL